MRTTERRAAGPRALSMPVPFLACMAAVAAFYHLPPRVLPSIQAVEGGRAGTIHRNADGSDDLGVMQVNTLWIAPLARYAKLSEEETRARLIAEPCFNIAAAGAILRTYVNEAHGDLMQAVGDYHSHTPSLNLSYRVLVIRSAPRKAPSPIRTSTQERAVCARAPPCSANTAAQASASAALTAGPPWPARSR